MMISSFVIPLVIRTPPCKESTVQRRPWAISSIMGRASSDCQYDATRRVILSALIMAPVLFPKASKAALEYPELHGLDEKPDGLPPFRNVNGVKIQEVAVGNGKSIENGAQVSINYVMRRSNGYFIDASYGFDRFETYTFRAGSGQVIQGFEIGIEGMREGGRRRFVVPPSLGFVKGSTKKDPGPIPPDFGARRSLSAHSQESIIFEVLVVRVKPATT